MEIYTTSFTYPRRLRHTHSPTNSLDFPPRNNELRRASSYSQIQQPNGLADHQGVSPADYEALQKLAMMAMSIHGVHISFTPADQGRAWNFQVSGAYQQVMSARGMLLKGCPIQVCCIARCHELIPTLATPESLMTGLQNRASIKVARSEILDSPSSKPALKPEVRRRLDDIASQTYAHIAVVNSPLSLSTRTLPDGITSSAGWSGLESERVCELVITGHGDSVDLARVRLLVMLDELVSDMSGTSCVRLNIFQSGLHAESCEIENTLHAIIAGRKRSVLQTIQEETATNIYLPSPLQGILGVDFSQSPSNSSPTGPNKANMNTIWITGEFFGVQRARDMLYQMSLSKVCTTLAHADAPMSRADCSPG